MDAQTIRASIAADQTALRRIYAAAFPDEDLWPLVTSLLPDPMVISLTAHAGTELKGHVLFTLCRSSGDTDNNSNPQRPRAEAPSGALLGPLAVRPERQRQGIGSRLIRTGLTQLERQGIRQVFVLGDPAYYGRFGFTPDRVVRPPCPIPEEWDAAWQSRVLPGGTALAPGTLRLPCPWMDPSLWTP